MRRLLGCAVIWGCCSSLGGCSAGGADELSPGAGAGTGAGGATGAGGGGFFGGGATTGGGDIPMGMDECGGDIYRGEASVLDMYILMDRSGSMMGLGGNPWLALIPGLPQVLGPDIWTPVGNALGTFVTSPQAAGASAGIGFFPLPIDAMEEAQTCDVNVYSTPAAPIAPLPANGPAIQMAILSHAPPSGGTPTRPAMEGAMVHARAWAQQHLDHKVIIVLATDGEPNDCNSTVDSVVQIAAGGLSGSPRVETYVIGIGNINGLNQIAQAGGSGQALIVDVDANVAAQQFLDAMNAIRGRAIPCDYGIPEAGRAAPDLVNLKYSDGAAGEVVIPFIAGGAAACDPAAGGWYYDASGTRAVTCPATCTTISNTATAQVRVVVGCPQVIR